MHALFVAKDGRLRGKPQNTSIRSACYPVRRIARQRARFTLPVEACSFPMFHIGASVLRSPRNPALQDRCACRSCWPCLCLVTMGSSNRPAFTTVQGLNGTPRLPTKLCSSSDTAGPRRRKPNGFWIVFRYGVGRSATLGWRVGTSPRSREAHLPMPGRPVPANAASVTVRRRGDHRPFGSEIQASLHAKSGNELIQCSVMSLACRACSRLMRHDSTELPGSFTGCATI